MVPLDAPAPGDAGAAATRDGTTAPSDGAQAVAAPTATAQIRAETDLTARTGVVVGVVVVTENGGRRCVDICLATLREAVAWSG
ncbi:hypothetical protein Msi02_39800 [Microbispora siamensis]|uniref:Uncharacterized protein n=1 Tax=Microbispora siamensis TaxID=564413 RepID=A0ABQ4GP10_9ACTN|nr:hypothetical protein Msi02_39800 [Microbispora siamensis]